MDKQQKKAYKKAKRKAVRPFSILTVISGLLSVVVLPVFLVLSMFDNTVAAFVGGTFWNLKNSDASAQYFTGDFASPEEMIDYGLEICRQVEAEGAALLLNKDGALPLEEGSAVSCFSTSSVNLVYGGTGSGNIDASTADTLRTALEKSGFSVNPTLWEFYSEGPGAEHQRPAGSMIATASAQVFEAPWSVYTDEVKNSVAQYGDAAIVVLSRIGGEGADLDYSTTNYLALDQNEKDMLANVTRMKQEGAINKVVVLINSANALQVDFLQDASYDIDACLWIGDVGISGINAVAQILAGQVNPSGRLVDTYCYDNYSAPAMANFTPITYGGYTEGLIPAHASTYMIYQEGIYVGYKYYETRYFDKVMNQGNAGDYTYSQTVQYPFGYGLSYTTFAWSDFTMSQMDAQGNIEVKVTVTNTGAVAGRDVVQLYLNAPYTEYDKANYVEKSAVSLVGFEKTGEIAPGQSETVTITVNRRDFISYDDVKAKTYILEAGDYLLTAAPNAHAACNNVLAFNGVANDGLFGTPSADFVGKWTYSYTENGGVDNQTYATSLNGTEITNQFDHASYDELTPRDQYLTRQDWVGTFPKTHGNQDSQRKSGFSERNGFTWEVEVSDEIRDALQSKGVGASGNPMTEEEAAQQAGKYSQKGDLELIDFRGRDFDEVEAEGGWDALIDQMDVKELESIIRNGGYQTLASSSIGKPRAIDFDGPSGLNEGGVTHEPYSITYPCAVNLANSWDRENSYLHGYYVGEDALAADG
ncbi:MAG TPA: glycosyl hydrolase, partial [Clostridiales bacterium]|nr:glycosyl hydrolase [Clostridiales bacterium]